LNEALDFANQFGKDIYVIGGERLYKEALSVVDRMYITEVLINVKKANSFFPEINKNEYDITYGKVLGNDIKYRKDVYDRRR